MSHAGSSTPRAELRIDFKCGCFTLIWPEGEQVQGGTSCCPTHDRLGLGFHGMEGKTVSNVKPGRLLNGPTAGLPGDTDA